MSERFHFSPRPNRAHEIDWQPWGQEAFDRARELDRPILLAIGAVWCHWCHVMDETSYSDEQVIRFINENYLAIKVDNDERPDVNQRYNRGGWPTTCILTPEGEMLWGATYVPPEHLRDALLQVRDHFREHRGEIAVKVTDLLERRRTVMAEAHQPAELRPDTWHAILGSTATAYDSVFGGFGDSPKFPHPEAIQLLLDASVATSNPDYLRMAEKTLAQMGGGGTYDHVEGGFFRYSTTRDWSVPHFEKMLEDNAQLLSALVRLSRISQDEEHRAKALDVVGYLDASLSDPSSGLFWGSQDADEEYYSRPLEERQKLEAPYIDRRVYTSWNAMAATAYAEAGAAFDEPGLVSRAERCLDSLWAGLMHEGGHLYRYRGSDGGRGSPGLLLDQAWAIGAALTLFEITGTTRWLDRAQALSDSTMLSLENSKQGGFYDRPEDGETLGLLAHRQRTMQENAVMADALTRLSILTLNDRYSVSARRALALFAGESANWGHFAAGYARVLRRLLGPTVDIRVVDAAAGPLHRAALAILDPGRVVQVIDPEADGGRLSSLGLPPDRRAAYVCVGMLCGEPINDPRALPEAVTRTTAMAPA